MLFEDFDETFLNYNINCKKKLDYFTESLEIKNQTKTKIILRSKNFYLDFFILIMQITQNRNQKFKLYEKKKKH